MTIDSIRPVKALWDLHTMRYEYGEAGRDEYGRPKFDSYPVDAFEVPTVSKALKESGMSVEYPGGRRFAVCLTHDVDLLYFGRTMVNLVRKDGLAHRLLHGLSLGLNPRWNMREIADLEERYGAKSTFFLEAFGPDDEDFNYFIEDAREQVSDLVERGFEIGLHGGHGAHKDFQKLTAEKARLEKVVGAKVEGYRGHYLRFDVPDTWHLLEQAGFSYDSTIGFVDRVGFRNGMCHPFWPFDLNQDKPARVLEIPLAVMDGALFEHRGMGIADAERLMDKLLAQVIEANGVLTILWHNTHCRGAYGKLYGRLLGKYHDQGAWLTSAGDLAKWWMEREEGRPG